MVLGISIASAFFVSLVSLAGALLYRSDERLVHFLMSLAAGTMLAASISHLLPEAVEETGFGIAARMFVIGVVFMFAVEKVISWHHCHDSRCSKKTGTMVVVGDLLHNFLDGIAIHASFSLSVPTGIAVSASILLHEIPQELGDFGVLIHSGYSRSQALMLNFLSGLSSLAGVLLTFLTGPQLAPYLAAVSAGAMMYVSMADIVPEMHRHGRAWLLYHISGLCMGIVLMFLL